MKTSEVLQHARWTIEASPIQEYPSTCRAIKRLQFLPILDRTSALALVEPIRFQTVEEWVHRNLPKESNDAKNFYKFRIMWLEALEKEFRAKGD